MLSDKERQHISSLVDNFKAKVLDNFGQASELLLTDEEIEKRLERLLDENKKLLGSLVGSLGGALTHAAEEIFARYRNQLQEQATAMLEEKISAYLQGREEQLKLELDQLCEELLTEFVGNHDQNDKKFVQQTKTKLRNILTSMQADTGANYPDKLRKKPSGW